MKALAFTGALDGLKVLDMADLPTYKRAVENGRQLGFAYYFPGLLALNRPGRRTLLVAQDDESVCIYRWLRGDTKPRLDILVAPTPMNVSVLQRCLDRSNEFNGDFSARVLRLDANDADAVGAVPSLRIKERKSQFLYDPKAFADIGGRKYRTVRRNVARVEALPDIEVAPFSKSHTDSCLELLRKWRRHHRETHGTLGGFATTRRVLELTNTFAAPDLRGEVVLIDGRLAAFALGGEIRPELGAFIEAKCDTTVPGLSYFHRYNFLSKQTQFALINDGSNMGRDGLGQLKNSLRPVAMHTEYRAGQRRGL